jgi:ParB/RepB/Spo0J family partition protein
VVRLVEYEDGSWQLRLNAGERRYRACKRAGIEAVPVLIKQWVSEVDEIYTGISENEERKKLSALDLGEAYSRLINRGETIEAIANRRNRDKRTIQKYISLAKLPDDVRKTIREYPDIFTTRLLFNEIASRKYDSDSEIREHIQWLIDSAGSAHTPPSPTEDAGEREAAPNGQSSPNEIDKDQADEVTSQPRKRSSIDAQLTERVIGGICKNVPLKVKVKGTYEKGRITINYASKEQLEKLLSFFEE